MNRRVKAVFLRCLRKAGAFRSAESSGWRKRRLLIIGYHGVSLDDEHHWDASLYLSAAAFEQRLLILKENRCTVLPLREALERLYEGKLPERAVALTFDDGTYDFYARAFPLLRNHNFPATVYLTTYYSQSNAPIFDVSVSYMLWKNRGSVVNARGLMPGFPERLHLATRAGRARAVRAIHAFARSENLDQAAKNECLERLASLLKFPFEDFRRRRFLQIMNPGEVSGLADAGIDFQLHTHRHRVPLDETLFAREIEDNRAAITAMTGRPANHFCYPSNVHHHQFLPWLVKLGIVSAATSEPGLASPLSHALLLPRLVDSAEVPAVEFESWISGLSGLFHSGDPTRRWRLDTPAVQEAQPPLGMGLEGERYSHPRQSAVSRPSP
ncbi:MAG: polysaccharide deacetylase family protein [bacterium]|jgi:peptidoglycan/xylan/chitin deacetylase (PgdA/CDA1 family)